MDDGNEADGMYTLPQNKHEPGVEWQPGSSHCFPLFKVICGIQGPC